MNRGASSSQTSRYEKSSRKGPRLIIFNYSKNQISKKLEALILKDKEIDLDDDKIKDEVRKDNIRKDYSKMAFEILSELAPFELFTENDIERQEQELRRLFEEMKAADRGERPSAEAELTRALYKKQKKYIKDLNASFKKIKEINQSILSDVNISKLAEYIEAYCEGRVDGIYNGSEDYWPDDTTRHINIILAAAEKQILEKFPMQFGVDNAEFSSDFENLPIEFLKTYRLRYAQSIVLLKSSELSAVLLPEDIRLQKDYDKAQIIYSSEISQLQFDILKKIYEAKKPEYIQNVINAAYKPILEQFARGERFGAYTFKYPESIKEQLEQVLWANRDLLLRREENEINLELYKEQFACYSALSDKPDKYGVTTIEEGKQYENLERHYREKCEEAQAIQQELNQKLAQIIERFIDDNSIKENQENLSRIQRKLGRKATHQNLSEIMSEAEKNTQLGYYDWMFTKTFASRCKRALLMATTMGAVGVGVGGVAGLGIFSAFTAGVGGVGGGLTGLVTGFVAPNIEQAASSNLGELKNLAITFFYGEQNAILKEYFEDPNNTKILARKYCPTARMIDAWGVDGANVIAHQYANLLFELHIKILYEIDDQNKDELEQKYKHFYRNYQMIRGDHAEIRKIYQGGFFGADRADREISKLDRLNIKEQASDDLAALVLIVSTEEQMNIRKLRTVINDVGDGLQLLAIEGGTQLLEQALQAPEVKKIASSFEQEIGPQRLMITDASDIKDPQPSFSVSQASSSSSPASSSALVPSSTAAQQMVGYNPLALEKQQLVTQVKKGASQIAEAYQKRKEIHDQYLKIESLATIARNADTTTSDIEIVSPGFISSHTQFIGDMSAFDAATYLMQNKKAYFKYWYNNIFLFNHKASSNEMRKSLISRGLRDGKGVVQFEAKSLWHILAENSVEGRKLFTQMMLAQQTAGFSPFIDYFDFEYKADNGMNAIVYAASLSSRNNSAICKAYVNELMNGYKSGTEDQINCDKTFKEILQLKAPQNPVYQVICMKLKDEIHRLWSIRESDEYTSKSYGQKLYSVTIATKPKFNAEAVLSQLMATMVIHCVDGNPIPQTEEELIAFINMYKKSSYIKGEIQTLLNRIETVRHIALETQAVTKNNPLYEFAKEYPDEKIRNLAIELCTSMPIPSPEEQAILIAILSNNISQIEQLVDKKDSTVIGLIYKNTKFKERNLIWIAIEANRPQIAAKLYTASYHEAMDKAGPNDTSAFSFSASQQDKTSCNLICRAITERSGLVSRAYVSRMKTDSTGAIGFHYLAQAGAIDDILQYFQTETRYTKPDWHRLTGGPDKGKYFNDQNGNLPLHLLLSRDDVVDIMRAIQDYATSSKIGLNTLFDLFAIESFELRNAHDTSPISLIMQNESLQRIFFEPLLDKANALYADANFRAKLFTCARFAFDHGNTVLLEQFMNTIRMVHERNIGRGYLANPVEQEVDHFLNYLISRLSDVQSELETNIICELLKSNADLASYANLKAIITNAMKAPVNQLIYDAVLPAAIASKIVSGEGTPFISRAASSVGSSSSPSTSSVSSTPSVAPDRNDDSSSRTSLILSGGHQLGDRENLSTVHEEQKTESKDKKKRDPK